MARTARAPLTRSGGTATHAAPAAARRPADYRRCLVSLEEMINGPLQQKKAALVETAKQVEANMEAVQRAAGVVRSETNADVAGIAERLEAAERQKLSLLQVDLTLNPNPNPNPNSIPDPNLNPKPPP